MPTEVLKSLWAKHLRTRANRVWRSLVDVIRMDAFCLLYMLLALVARLILTIVGAGWTGHVIFNVVAELCFVVGFIAVLPRVSVGGRTFIRTFRYRWEPYLALGIYGFLFFFIARVFFVHFHESFWNDDFIHEIIDLGMGLATYALALLYFLIMFFVLPFCRLPRVLVARTALGPFSLIIGVCLLAAGLFGIAAGFKGGLATGNCLFLFLYITFSISAGLKRPHRKRLRK